MSTAGFTDLAQPSQRLHSLAPLKATLSSPVAIDPPCDCTSEWKEKLLSSK